MAERVELSKRQRDVLRFVVAEHIGSAAPVGSWAVVRKHEPGVSAATVRNDMAVLEAGGYLYQPHTSAGRVPSDKGYRYFVEWLLDEQEISAEHRARIRQRLVDEGLSVEEGARLAAYLLAHTVNNAAIVCMPSGGESRLKHVELIAVQESTALLVVLLLGGTLKQQVIVLPRPLRDDQLAMLAHRLTHLYGGLSSSEIERKTVALSPLERELLDAVIRVMRQADSRATEGLHFEGLSNILNQPEFARSEKVRYVLEALEREALPSIMFSLLNRQGVQVRIGQENDWPPLYACSLVMARYGQGVLGGMLGVLGPTRLDYSRTIPTVRYLAGVLTELVSSMC